MDLGGEADTTSGPSAAFAHLTISHDAGSGAMPYVAGTMLAIEKVMATTGLIRGLDRLLFDN
jgi:hypothetical protein